MGKFIIHVHTQNQGPTIFFELIARNGEAIATSLPFSSLTACKRCISSVIRTSPIAKFLDMSNPKKIPAKPTITNPRFELYRDAQNSFRFRLKARNGEIILVSSPYTTKASCKNGITSVCKNVSDAPTILLQE